MNKKSLAYLVSATPFFVLVSGCLELEKKADEKQLSNELNIYNWEDYFGETTLEDEDPLTIQKKLISGEILIGHIYSGDGFVAADSNEDITYIIPDEGTPIWIDNMFIPVDSPHKYTAEVFINYILDPEVSGNITNYLWYANPNTAANAYIDSEILEDPGIYPSQEVLDNCEFFSEKTAILNSEYNRIWSLLQYE